MVLFLSGCKGNLFQNSSSRTDTEKVKVDLAPYEKRKYEEEIKEATALIKADAKNVEAYYNRADAYAELVLRPLNSV